VGGNTSIEWAHDTFNPWQGCTKVGLGCKNCYADELDKRHLWSRDRHWGARAPRLFASDVHMARPLAWNRKAERAGVRRRVFCMSLGDFFELHENPRTAARQSLYRARVFQLIDQTPWLDWLLLTKRPENVQGMVPWREAGERRKVPLPVLDGRQWVEIPPACAFAQERAS